MYSEEESKASFKRDMWEAINGLCERLSRIDMVRLIAEDVVAKISDHFARIRTSKEEWENSPTKRQMGRPRFEISPHLVSKTIIGPERKSH